MQNIEDNSVEQSLPEIWEEKRRENLEAVWEDKRKAKAERDALKKEKKQNYPKLTPQEWQQRYGEPKPKIGLIEEKTAVKVIARRLTGMALHTLASICEGSRNDAARVSAAREILDRGWGKAHIAAEGETKPGSDIVITFGNQSLLDRAKQPANGEDSDDEQ